MNQEDIKSKITKRLPSAVITLTDLTGGGDHWQINIEAKEFAGKSLIEQHQLVYESLGDLMKEKIHALSIQTKTPS